MSGNQKIEKVMTSVSKNLLVPVLLLNLMPKSSPNNDKKTKSNYFCCSMMKSNSAVLLQSQYINK
jgi:hypothetical protein